MTRWTIIASLLTALLMVTAVMHTGHSGEIRSIQVERQGHSFTIAIESRIDAPPRSVYRSLTDYAALSTLSPAIKQSAVLRVIDDHTQRVESVTHLCVLVFCKDITQVQDMLRISDRALAARIIPAASDLRTGHARWQLRGQDQTTLRFTARVAPDFWVPPWLGEYLIRHMLRNEARQLVAGLEDSFRQARSRGR